MVMESTSALEMSLQTMLIYCLALARLAQDAYGALWRQEASRVAALPCP